MNRQHTLLSTLLVWAMLPLAVLSCSPRSACLCSNGDLKFSCRTAAEQRSCCAESGSLDHTAGHNSPRQHSCCRGNGGSPQSSPACTVAGCHCTAVVVLPDASPKVETTTAPDFEIAVNRVSDDVSCGLQLSPQHAFGFHPAPPEEGRDLVILLSRMLA